MIDLADIDLEEFITKWYGMPDKSAMRRPDRADLPESLVTWYELSSRWSVRLHGVKSFVPLDEVSFRDGKAVFLADPANAIWALDSSANVYEGHRYEGWTKLPESLPEFLTHNAIMEAAYASPNQKACDSIKNSRIPNILAPMTEVAAVGWNWPGPDYRIFMSDSLIAVIGPALNGGAPVGEDGFSEVQIGATTPAALSYLESVPGDWF